MTMTEERKTSKGTGCAGWMTMASIALNLFLVGVLVGPMLGPDRDGDRMMPREPRGPGFMLERMTRDLPEQDAQKVQAIFEEERKNGKDHHAHMRDMMKRLAAVLKQEKPDQEALRKAMDEIHAFGEGLHEGMSRAFERVATEVSFEGRQAIAKAMENGLFKGGAMPPPPMPPEERGDARGPDDPSRHDDVPPPMP